MFVIFNPKYNCHLLLQDPFAFSQYSFVFSNDKTSKVIAQL